VRYLAGERGIRQFLDIGTGIPASSNTHEVAQSVAPGARLSTSIMIIVHVDHVHARREPKDSLGQLVHVGLSRKAAAEIEELPDPALGGQVPDQPAQKRPLVPGYRRDVGNRVQELPGCLAVGAKLSLPPSR
jgi:hypothetical protein